MNRDQQQEVSSGSNDDSQSDAQSDSESVSQLEIRPEIQSDVQADNPSETQPNDTLNQSKVRPILKSTSSERAQLASILRMLTKTDTVRQSLLLDAKCWPVRLNSSKLKKDLKYSAELSDFKQERLMLILNLLAKLPPAKRTISMMQLIAPENVVTNTLLRLECLASNSLIEAIDCPE